jgi:hypothetical protein
MSKRKGMSLEEKRDKLLEVFTDSADVFVLKVGFSTSDQLKAQLCDILLSLSSVSASMRPAEASSVVLHATAHAACCTDCCLVGLLQDVEKLGARKGIVLQSIKEVLQVSYDAASWSACLLQLQRVYRHRWYQPS